MIHLKSIELVNFKGISRLQCDFEDVTILAGLNNSGKTTILQAVYLLLASLPKIAAHSHIDHTNKDVRVIPVGNELSPLGLRDTGWLSSILEPDLEGAITGHFANALTVHLDVDRNVAQRLFFTLSQCDPSQTAANLHVLIEEASRLSAAILTPPGEVPWHEEMVPGNQYQSWLREGKGAQMWRNSIWWGIQTDGFESFAPVQEQISKYFSGTKLLIPTLSPSGAPEILIKYLEDGKGPLDIAQSGAGLRTFISLTRILKQSSSQIILLDEPDAHLHASQQAVVLDLMLNAAFQLGRQVIIATHAPEIISRVPNECLRWVERGASTAHGGEEVGNILQRLGATPDIYIPWAKLPDVLVYVEGVKDRPIIDGLIRWCRRQAQTSLPTTLVISHRDGRFEEPTLRGIARFVKAGGGGTRVVGVRDRDWYYGTLPSLTPEQTSGEGWSLITLPCKEMENLLCHPDFLFEAYEGKLDKNLLLSIIDEESKAPELLEEWQYQVLHRIRGSLPREQDQSTRERIANTTFKTWSDDPAIRRRLVAGKELLARVKIRVRHERSLSFYPSQVFDRLSALPPELQAIANQIFPS